MAKEAKDMLGNVVKLGDFVRITAPEHCLGRIVNIEGGSSLSIGGTRRPGEPKIINGKIFVEVIMQAEFDPRDVIAGHLLKVEDPMPPEEKRKTLERLKLVTN